MDPISDTSALAGLCRRLASAPYITVDTEFMRERTYWPILCLVQVAGPDEEAAIDPLSEGIDLAPLFELLSDKRVLKVFHAARQDLEIFHRLTGKLPAPLFDTQVAAMVCGFGESVGYETLVAKLAGARIDKTSQFTDWSARPLRRRQTEYAIADVTHLRPVYEALAEQLAANGRASWLAEEMAILTDPGIYEMDADLAFLRIKSRDASPRFLAILRELAAWREREARRRDIPRNRVLRDGALVEIAHHRPSKAGELGHTRGLGNRIADGKDGKAILEAVERGLRVADGDCPRSPVRPRLPEGNGPVSDLLKVLLRMKCEEWQVARKLVANASDVELIAALGDAAEVPALNGWRRQVFGEEALKLRGGRISLAAENGKLKSLPVDGGG